MTTDLAFSWGTDAEFVIGGAQGTAGLIPEKRTYTVKIHGVTSCADRVSVFVNGFTDAPDSHPSYDPDSRTLTCTLEEIPSDARIRILVKDVSEAENDIVKEAFDFLNQAEISFVLKDTLYRLIENAGDRLILLSQLQTMELEPDLLGALTEIITA